MPYITDDPCRIGVVYGRVVVNIAATGVCLTVTIAVCIPVTICRLNNLAKIGIEHKISVVTLGHNRTIVALTIVSLHLLPPYHVTPMTAIPNDAATMPAHTIQLGTASMLHFRTFGRHVVPVTRQVE